MHHRLANLLLALAMVLNPLVGPRNRLFPPIRVGVERAEVDIFQCEFGIKVPSIGSIVCPVIRLNVESTLTTPGHEMVGVQLLHECAHLVNPACEEFGIAVGLAAGEVTDGIGATAGFIGKLPGHDGGGIDVTGHEGFNVVLVCILDGRDAIELHAMLVAIIDRGFRVQKTDIVVVLSAQVDGIHIHATIIGPVVCERDH